MAKTTSMVTAMTAKTVDSYRFLAAISKRAMKRCAGLPGETQIPWAPLAKPLSNAVVSLVSSAAIAFSLDKPLRVTAVE